VEDESAAAKGSMNHRQTGWARTKATDEMMPVRQRSCGCVIGLDSGGFLGRTQIAR